MDCDKPISNKGEIPHQSVLVKAKKNDKSQDVQELMDKDDMQVLNSIICAEDHKLYTEWDMYYYRLRMSHMENAKADLTKVLEAEKKDDIDLNLSLNHKKLLEGNYFFYDKTRKSND